MTGWFVRDHGACTGPSRVGAELKAASGLKRVAPELGGSEHTIVCEDASVEDAATICARNEMRLAGQSCAASRYRQSTSTARCTTPLRLA